MFSYVLRGARAYNIVDITSTKTHLHICVTCHMSITTYRAMSNCSACGGLVHGFDLNAAAHCVTNKGSRGYRCLECANDGEL